MDKERISTKTDFKNKKEEFMKKFIAFFISLVCIVKTNEFIQINDINIRFSNSILSVFIFAVNLFLTYKYIKDIDKDRRLSLVSLIFGFIISFSIISGNFLEYEQTILSIRYLVSLCSFSIPLAGVSKILFEATIKVQEKQATNEKVKKRFMLYFLIIFISYIPIFLAYYPTIFAYDVHFQLNEMLHHNNTLHHPLIHTLFIYVCYKFGIVIGSVGIGMAIYSIIQMLIMSLIFSYFLNYMHEKGINKKIIYIALVFFAIFPVNSILSLSTTKDVIFSGLFLLTFIKFYEFVDSKKITLKWKISYIIISVFMLLFRNNAIYALLLAIPVILFFNKKNRKVWIILNIISIMLFSIIYSTMAYIFEAKPTEKSERIPVPIQQVARVYVEKQDELDTDLKKEIEIFFKEDIREMYIPFFADGIKTNINTNEEWKEYFESNISKFLKLWA